MFLSFSPYCFSYYRLVSWRNRVCYCHGGTAGSTITDLSKHHGGTEYASVTEELQALQCPSHLTVLYGSVICPVLKSSVMYACVWVETETERLVMSLCLVVCMHVFVQKDLYFVFFASRVNKATSLSIIK